MGGLGGDLNITYQGRILEGEPEAEAALARLRPQKGGVLVRGHLGPSEGVVGTEAREVNSRNSAQGYSELLVSGCSSKSGQELLGAHRAVHGRAILSS